MVYHRSESGSGNSRGHHRYSTSRDEEGSDSEGRSLRRDEKDRRDVKHSSDSQSRDKYSRGSRGRESSRDDKREDSRNWDNNTRHRENSDSYLPPIPRYNNPDCNVRHRDSGQFNQQVAAQYQADNNYLLERALAQKTEEEKKKNVFQNDGSFLEMFKKMQENKAMVKVEVATSSVASGSCTVISQQESQTLPTKKLPMVGKRRGGRVLKTGMVKKLKVEKPEDSAPKNAWSMYMNEVRKYKEASCEEEGKTRPLVK